MADDAVATPNAALLNQLQYWSGQITSAQKREKEFRKDGRQVVDIYEGKRLDSIPFNILYSNTETLAPALYNTTPRPVVQRRFKNDDMLAKAGATVMEKILEFYMDSGDAGENDFDALLKSATLEALVPGRGVTRFKYDAEFEKLAAPETPPTPADGAVSDTQPPEKVTYECVEGEEICWDRILFGYAKRWKDVPWIAFEHFFTETEAVENFGEEARKWEYVDNSKFTGDDEEGKSEVQDDAEGSQKTLHCFEIWNKGKKQVLFFAPSVTDNFLKAPIPDPLGLSGFWPIPRPMSFLQKIADLTPVALYTLYQQQAEELNTITLRIKKLIKMLKVAGMYDANVDSLAKALEAEDGTLEPIENSGAMSAGNGGGGLDKAIWLIPIEKISTVVQNLYLQRQQIKQVIYEITGVSDILRGSTVASETATAQNIKNQWGTLRLKRWQKEVMRYVRSSLRLMGEIAVTKLGQDTIREMTGLKFPTAEEKAAAKQKVDSFLAATESAQALGQQPPQPPPNAQEIQETAQSPSWEEILGMLQNDRLRSYKIDIETNSTVDADATEDKQDISDLLNAMSQFMGGVAPLVESGAMPFEAAQAMLMMIVRRFRLGSEIEDALKMMKPPEPKEDKSKVEAEQVKMQVTKAQAEADMAKISAEVEATKADASIKKMLMEAELAIKQAELELKRQELDLKRQEMGFKMEAAAALHAQKMIQIKTPKPAPKSAQTTPA